MTASLAAGWRDSLQVEAVWRAAPIQRNPVDWALQWVWSLPAVSLVLSGMSTMKHVEDDLLYADRSRPGLLGADELAVVSRVRDLYRQLTPVPCTACRYCMPCPQGVAIPDVLRLYNDAHIYGDPARQRFYYTWLDEAARAGNCTACGACEEACPQDIAVAGWMEKAQAFLGMQ